MKQAMTDNLSQKHDLLVAGSMSRSAGLKTQMINQ